MTKGKIENPFDLNTKPYEEFGDVIDRIDPTGSLEGKGGKYLRVKTDETGTEWASGGGSGTDDYDDLTNKPKIAGTELIGNLSLDTLGICKNTWASTDVGKVLTIGSDYKVYAQTGGGSAVWGGITGTLSDQADLNAKFTSIDGTISSLSGTVAGHAASIATLGNQMSGVQSDISTLQTAVSNKVPISTTTSKTIVGLGCDSNGILYVEVSD